MKSVKENEKKLKLKIYTNLFLKTRAPIKIADENANNSTFSIIPLNSFENSPSLLLLSLKSTFIRYWIKEVFPNAINIEIATKVKPANVTATVAAANNAFSFTVMREFMAIKTIKIPIPTPIAKKNFFFLLKTVI
jgi:hypothetical protein